MVCYRDIVVYNYHYIVCILHRDMPCIYISYYYVLFKDEVVYYNCIILYYSLYYRDIHMIKTKGFEISKKIA